MERSPPKLITHLSKYLNPADYQKASVTCRRWQTAMSMQTVWRMFALRDFAVNHKLLSPVDDVKNYFIHGIQYGKWTVLSVLYGHRRLLGWWRRSLGYYGGLCHIHVDKTSPFMIICREYLPPIDTHNFSDEHAVRMLPESRYSDRRSHRWRLLWTYDTVTKTIKSNMTVACAENQHDVQMKNVSDETITLACTSSNHHTTMGQFLPDALLHECGIQLVDGMISLRLIDQHVLHDLLSERHRKYESFYHNSSFAAFKYDLESLQWPDKTFFSSGESDASEPWPKPGLYFAGYSIHGWEIVRLTYTEDRHRCRSIVLHKITGDRNIPAGCTTVIVNTTKPMSLTEDDLHNWDNVHAVLQKANDDRPDMSIRTSEMQPFIHPDERYIRHGNDLPTTTHCRYLAYGRLAGADHMDEAECLCAWSQLDRETFAIESPIIKNIQIFFKARLQPRSHWQHVYDDVVD